MRPSETDTGDSLATDDSEAEALVMARVLIEAYGPEYAGCLDLGYADERDESRRIASGSALLELVDAAVPELTVARSGIERS